MILQLWVSDERSSHAVFGATEARGEGGGPTFNLNPTDQGPLAYEVIWRGDGWRAALAGSRLDLARLAGGVAAAVVAVLLSPPVARRIRRALGRIHAAMLVVGRLVDGKLRLTGAWPAPQGSPGAPASNRRAIYLFPWLIPAFAILHFLANNLLVVRAYEAIAISIVIMAGVTITFVGLRFILRSAAAAAVFHFARGHCLFFLRSHLRRTGSSRRQVFLRRRRANRPRNCTPSATSFSFPARRLSFPQLGRPCPSRAADRPDSHLRLRHNFPARAQRRRDQRLSCSQRPNHGSQSQYPSE